jgi:hypothetical protein
MYGCTDSTYVLKILGASIEIYLEYFVSVSSIFRTKSNISTKSVSVLPRVGTTYKYLSI